LSGFRAASRLAQLDAERATRPTSAPVLEDQFFRGIVGAAGATMRQYTHALTAREGLITALEQFFTEWDAWLCRVTSGPAFAHYPMGVPVAVDDVTVSYATLLTHTRPFNLTGYPVVVLPLTRSRQELPIGLQVVGRRWREVDLLAIARQPSEIVGPLQDPPGY
jgi:amidase